jgi:hypothetical protein
VLLLLSFSAFISTPAGELGQFAILDERRERPV